MRAALAVLAAIPTLALAQAGALDAARAAGAKQQAAAAERMKAADAPLADPPAGAAPDATSATASDAAAPPTALESQVGALPGTEVQLDPSAATASHTVQRGDTLWDLSAKYLQDPYAWPRIWSLNPQIADPHWIYPGHVVRIAPGAGQPAGAPVAEAPTDDSDLAQPPQELAGFSAGSIDRPSELGQGDEVTISGHRKIGLVARSGLRARKDRFVTASELERSGVLTAAFEDKLMLTVQDRAYAKVAAGSVKPGESLAIFRTDRELLHPRTGKPFGYRTTVLGAARVASVEGDTATVEITAASDAIERGDRVGVLAGKLVSDVTRRPNRKDVDGVILAADVVLQTEIGEHHYVYVDRGSADGVEAGNVFDVVRSGDPYEADSAAVRRDGALPIEHVGALLVVEATEHASTALVVKSERELVVGDRVEMRVAAASPRAGK